MILSHLAKESQSEKIIFTDFPIDFSRFPARIILPSISISCKFSLHPPHDFSRKFRLFILTQFPAIKFSHKSPRELQIFYIRKFHVVFEFLLYADSMIKANAGMSTDSILPPLKGEGDRVSGGGVPTLRE